MRGANHKPVPEGLRVWRGRAPLTQVEKDTLLIVGVWVVLMGVLVVVTEILKG